MFLLVHGIAHHVLLIATHRLDVDAHGPVADSAGHGLAAVAQAEVNLRVTDDEGFAVRTVFKQRVLRQSVLLAQCLL